MTTAVVLAGGILTRQLMPRDLVTGTASCVVIAADSGLDLADHLGLDVDVVVGDFDSVSDEALARARARHADIRSYPTDKDATDLELALDVAVEHDVDRIVVLGGAGGRLDHLLGNVGVLAAASVRHAVEIEAWLGEAYVAVVLDRWSRTVRAGATLSVLPWSGSAVVSETGVRWPLSGHRIEAGSTLGVSNEALGGDIVITIDEGVALVVCPDAEVVQ